MVQSRSIVAQFPPPKDSKTDNGLGSGQVARTENERGGTATPSHLIPAEAGSGHGTGPHHDWGELARRVSACLCLGKGGCFLGGT